RSLTRAAEKLYISQPSVTYRIQQIEKYYEVEIFKKIRKGIRFTAEGEILVGYAKKLLVEHRAIQDTLLNIGDELRGTLRIGVALNFAHYKLPILLKEFCDKYPRVKVILQTALSPEVMELLQNDIIDVGIESGGYKWQGEKRILRTDKICIISKEEIEVEQLPFLPMIKNKTNSNLKDLIETWWNANFKHPPNVMMEVDHITTCKEMIKSGLGYGIVPSDCLRDNEPFYINELKINGKAIQRKTWLNYRNSLASIRFVDEFIKFILEKTDENSMSEI